jgi:DNA-directed RNA polymerase III subunit RPC6
MLCCAVPLRVEALEDAQGECYRPSVLALPTSTAFTSIPCGVCPVIDQCQEGGQISPQTCVYYQKWLEF